MEDQFSLSMYKQQNDLSQKSYAGVVQSSKLHKGENLLGFVEVKSRKL